MALTLENAPAQFSFVGNPVIVKLKTNNLIISAGVKAINELIFASGNAADGQSFNFTWGDQSVTFTFKTNPDGSGTQLSLAGSLTLTQFLTQLAEQLGQNNYIDADFNVTSDATKVYLTAKKTGAEYNLTFTMGDPAVVDMTFDNQTEGTDTIYQENLKIKLKIMGYSSTLLTYLGDDSLSPDADGYCEFNIAEYLRPLFKLKYQFPEPAVGEDLIYHRPGSVGPFQIQYCEVIAGVDQKLTKPTAKYYAMGGGVSSEDLKYYRLFQVDYYNYASNDARFLTWCPDNKIVNKTQSERLFFFTKDDITDLSIYCEIKYTDASTHAFFAETLENAEKNSVYEIVCGFKALNLDSFNPAKTVDSYKITLYDSASISDTRTFIVDNTEYLNEKHFDFRTSFSGYDHARFTGEFIRNLETDRESATVVNEYFEAEALDQHIEGKHAFKANTGWLDRVSGDAKEYLHYLNDLLLSMEIWEIKGMVRTRIRITSKKFVKHSTKKHLYSLKFNYEYVSSDQYHSNEVSPLDKNYLFDEEILLTDEGRALTN